MGVCKGGYKVKTTQPQQIERETVQTQTPNFFRKIRYYWEYSELPVPIPIRKYSEDSFPGG